jgi:hypothetical protein
MVLLSAATLGAACSLVLRPAHDGGRPVADAGDAGHDADAAAGHDADADHDSDADHDADADHDSDVDHDADADHDTDADHDADDHECDGAAVGGHCWYLGAVNGSCDEACATHGGCDLVGTRDFAGSHGTDEHCRAVLAALGYGDFSHQPFSNNALGCHFAWGSWTYWSQAFSTTCEGSSPGAPAGVIRMCACLR